MALQTLTVPRSPGYPSTRDTEVAVDIATFGDGYEQRSEPGLNARRNRVTLVWPVLEKASADDLEAFLVARGGSEAFLYAAPRDIERKWRVDGKWTREAVSGLYDKFTLPLIEVFDL